MTVVNQKRNMKDRDSSKQEADHHAKKIPRTAWLMTILQAKNTTVGIVATCGRRGPDLETSITTEIAYYTHRSLITQNCQWKYLSRPTASKIVITHHHQLLLQETAWPGPNRCPHPRVDCGWMIVVRTPRKKIGCVWCGRTWFQWTY